MTLFDFLLSRISEDERYATHWDPGRVLAECEAKRQILKIYAPDSYYGEEGMVIGGNGPEVHDEVLRHLAAVYSDHPDWRKEWRP